MFLALREMKHAKLRYLLIGLIMVLISWLVLFVTGLANGLSSDNASSIQNMNADYLILQKDSDNQVNRSEITKDLAKEAGKYTDASDTEKLGLQMSTVLKGETSKKLDVTFFAVDQEGFLAPKITEGKAIDNNDKNGIVANASLKNEGLRLGDKIKDQISGKVFTIKGFTEGQSFSHTPVVFVNLEEWGNIQSSVGQEETTVNAIALKATDKTAAKIEKEMKDVNVLTVDESLKGIPGYSQEQSSLLMMIVFLFIISAIVLAVFFYVITLQKINQFGVLKAIGAKTSYLSINIVSQVTFLTILSLIVSVSITYGLSFILPAGMPFVLTPSVVLICSGLFLVVSLGGAALSLYRVAKVDAIDAIGRAV
ncbi:ABC transporter permease [Mesobacillus zeae]|uniref:Putative hemin transport system permease protein HrtB n=1 Tax=Mesobacillus zeae TaxID=1917180 RepID=A0A398BI99_9BACI|nr:ABC transporter permease [Mesobacillus zeae]RID88278.1 ABC transporter permease [Mesobacillus zeae]